MTSLSSSESSQHAQGAHHVGERAGEAISRAEVEELRRFEIRLQRVCAAVPLLAAVTPRNAAAERARLVAALAKGAAPRPRWQYAPSKVSPLSFRLVDILRRDAERLPTPRLYQARLDELELDLMILEAIGRPRRVRPLALRRFGSGAMIVPGPAGPVPLRDYAARVLRNVPAPSNDPCDDTPADVAAVVRAMGALAGIDVEVRIDPDLAAAAAVGGLTVFVAARPFGWREATRIAVHEVLGHLVSEVHGREQPLRLLHWGTAGSFADQEGVALHLEQLHGCMDGARLRMLALRVVATDWMHEGAGFAQIARRLHREHGLTPQMAVGLAERAHRGGGVARDAGYLAGMLRVRDALARGVATLQELRIGRVGIDALADIRELARRGHALRLDGRLDGRVSQRANFSRSLRSTKGGTMPFRLPPSEAASLIRLELK